MGNGPTEVRLRSEVLQAEHFLSVSEELFDGDLSLHAVLNLHLGGEVLRDSDGGSPFSVSAAGEAF